MQNTQNGGNNKQKCEWCNSGNCYKSGKRRTHQGVKQMWFCRNCESKFTDGKIIEPTAPAGYDEPLPRQTYQQNWEAYNKSQTQEGQMLRKILSELCSVAELKRNKIGRPRADFRDLAFAACIKAYTGFSSRRLISELQYAYGMEYLSHVPHFNMVLKALNSKEITWMLQEIITSAALPLKMVEDTYATDSTGFSSSMFGRWLEKKYGDDKEQRVWVKAHAMIGVRTNVVTSVEVTPQNAGDSPMFIPLLEKTAKNAKIVDVCADKAYSSKANLEAVAKLGAMPYIPFRSNTTGKAKGSKVWKTIYNYFILNQEEFMDHYHQRSNIESTFSMIKRKFGNHLKSKNFIAMKNEVLAKVAVHNICCLIASTFELGVSPELIWGKPKEITTPVKVQVTAENVQN